MRQYGKIPPTVASLMEGFMETEQVEGKSIMSGHMFFMRHAFALAERCSVKTSPNPRVGCVIVKAGRIIGEGFTQPVGGNHAEIEALAAAAALNEDVRGATVYVTLEPCSHHGRTPPCTEALIRAKVGKVVAAMQDPNPQVAGNGFRQLREAGIEVLCGVLEQQAREMNLGFLSRVERGRPWVRVKIAASLDGKTALPNGQSQWITSEAARLDGHRWRMKADAVMTGIGTVLTDDPQLNVRLPEVVRQPIRIVVDSHLKTPVDAKVLGQGNVWLFAANASPLRIEALKGKGAEVFAAINDTGRVDLHEMMRVLAEREINEVHVEAGATLSGALVEAGLVDELLLYLAPCCLGRGRDMLGINALPSLDDRIALDIREMTRIDGDLRIVARVLDKNRKG